MQIMLFCVRYLNAVHFAFIRCLSQFALNRHSSRKFERKLFPFKTCAFTTDFVGK